MKKIISLLALVGLLLLPVLAGCMDEAPAFLRVSAAEAETDIGETVSVEDAQNIRVFNISMYDDYGDRDDLYIGTYLGMEVYAPGAMGLRIWVDGELADEGGRDQDYLDYRFSEAGEHTVSISGNYNGQWSDPREVWRGEVKTKGEQEATTFTVETPENAGDSYRVVFDWKDRELRQARLSLYCVDGDTESELWNDYYDEDGLWAGRKDISIPAKYLGVPGEYVLKLFCEKVEYDPYTFTKRITVPGTAPGFPSVIINNNEPVVIDAESSSGQSYEIPVRLSKTGAAKFEWYDSYYGDETDTEETAAVDGAADIVFSTRCYGGYNDRRIAARAWVGDEENGVWTNWYRVDFSVQVNVTEEEPAQLPLSYTISDGGNGTVVISVTGMQAKDTIEGFVRGADGVMRKDIYQRIDTGTACSITLTGNELDTSGTYYVSLRSYSRNNGYSAYGVRKFVYSNGNNIPGPVISLLPEPADGNYSVNTAYQLRFEKENAASFEYRWETDAYKKTVRAENGIPVWGEEEDIVSLERPAEVTILCRARLADGTWTDWEDETFTFVSKGSLPQPGLSLGGENQPGAGYDLDVLVTACDTDPGNVNYYYIGMTNTGTWDDISWEYLQPADFTEANTYTWHISGSMLVPGSYRVEVYAYAQNGYSDAKKVTLEFELPEPDEPMAEGPEVDISSDEDAYYPGEVTVTAYAENAVQYRFRYGLYRQMETCDVAADENGAGVLVPELKEYCSYYFYVSYRKSADGPWSAETFKEIYVSSTADRMPSQDLRLAAGNNDPVPAGSDLVFAFTPVKDTEDYYYTEYLSNYYLTVYREVQDGEDERVLDQTIWPNRLEEAGITVDGNGDYLYTCPGKYLLVSGEYYAGIRALSRWGSHDSAMSRVRFTVTDEGYADAPVITVAPGDHYVNESVRIDLGMEPGADAPAWYYLICDGEYQTLETVQPFTYLQFGDAGTYPVYAVAKRFDGSWTKSAAVSLVISSKGTADPIGLTVPEEHPQWKELTAVLAEPLPDGARLSIDLRYYDEEDEYWTWWSSTYVESCSEDNTAWLFSGEVFTEPGRYRLEVITEIPGYYDSEEWIYEFTVTEMQQPDAPAVTIVSETVWYDAPFTFTVAAEGADVFNYRIAYGESGWYGDTNADADENGTAQIEASASPYHGLEPFVLEVRARINGAWSKWGTAAVEPQGTIMDPVAVTGIKDIQVGESLPLEFTLPEEAAGFHWWLYRAAESEQESDECIYSENGYYTTQTVQMTLDEGIFSGDGTYYLATQADGETGCHYYGTYTEHARFTVTGTRLPGPQVTLEGLAEGQEEILVNQEVTFTAWLEGAAAYECRWRNSVNNVSMELAEDGKGIYRHAFENDDFSDWIECRAKVDGVWTEWASLAFTVAKGIQLPVPDFSGLRKEWTIGEALVIPVTGQGVRELELCVYKSNEYGDYTGFVGRFRSENGSLTVPEAEFGEEGYFYITGVYRGLAGYADSETSSDRYVLHFTGSRYTAPVITLPADGVWINDYNVFTFEPPAGEYTADSYEVCLFNTAGELYDFGSADGQEGSWTWYPTNEGTFTLKVRAAIGGFYSGWSEKSFAIQSNGELPISFSGKPAAALYPGQDFSLTFTGSVEGEVYTIEVYPEGDTTGTSLVSTTCWGDGSVAIDTSDLAEGSYYVKISSSAPRYTFGSDGFTFTMDPSSLMGPRMTIENKEKYVIWEPFTVTLQHEDEVSEYWLEARWYDEENNSSGTCSGSSTETPGVYTLTLTTKGTWTVRARAKIGEYWTQWTEKTVTVTSLGVAQYPELSYDRTVLRGDDIVVTIAPAAGTDSITLKLMSGETSIATYVADCSQENTVTFSREHFELTEGEYVLRVSPGPAVGYEQNPVTHKDYPVTMNCFTLTGHEYQAATCTADGNTEYWYCTTCGKYYADADATREITAESTVIPATGHISPLDHTEAKAATCTEDGNIEYWHCTRCDGYFTDADAETEIQAADIVIPALGHDDPLAHTAAKPASCTETGNSEYWYCSRCDRYFSDEAAENEVALADTVIPATGHDTPMEHTAAKPATCTEPGNIQYWHCTRCGKYFKDSGANAEIALADTVVPARGHIDPLVHVQAKAAGCTEEGNVEYWYCSRCDGYFSDNAAETEINRADVIIQAKGHNYPLAYTAAKPATCTETGNIEYWHCSDCGRNFSDENAVNEISGSVIIPKLSHTMTAHPAVEATCTTAGNSAYWYCTACEKYYGEAQGTAEIDEGSWIINALGHKMTHHPAVAEATCTEAVSSEYWSCDRCHKYFADEAGNTEIGENSWITGDEALGHDWGEPEYTWSADNRKCTATRTCKRDESHIETENGTVTSQTTPATRTAAGKTVYTATFTNPAFAAQVKEETIPKLAAPVGSYTDKATGTYEIRADWTATFKKPAKSKATVTIPDTIKVKGYDIPVTAIADKAFSKDKNLTTVTIGKNVITIGKNAFNSCAKLKTVKGGAAVEVIKDSAFSGSAKLKTLPSFPKLKTIGANAFKGCKALTKVTIGAKVNSIGKNAFNGCAALKTITIKSTLLTKKNVKSGAFKGINAKATVKCPKKQLKDYRKFLPGKGVPKTAKIK